MAVTLRDTEDKLRSELAKSKKLLVAMDMKKEISDKLINSIQLDNETLKNEIIVERKSKEEKFKEEALEIEALMEEKLLMKNKNKDLLDENEMQRTKMLDLEEFMKNKTSSST